MARTKSSLHRADVHHPDGPESSLTHRRKETKRGPWEEVEREGVLLVRKEVSIETEKYIETERVRQHVTQEMHLSQVTSGQGRAAVYRDFFQIYFSAENFCKIYTHIYSYFYKLYGEGDYNMYIAISNSDFIKYRKINSIRNIPDST